MLSVALLLALAQDPGPGLVFPAGIDLVQVVVSVTTKDGAPVRDLTASDFAIRENGKPRVIESFLRTQDARDSERVPVELLLLLDTSTSMSADLRNARDVIVDFTRAVPSFSKGRVLAFDRDAYDRGFDAKTVGPVVDDMIRLKGGAGTRIFDAIVDGAALVSKQKGLKVMVLFTDGDDSTSRRSRADAMNALQGSEVTCYVVSYASRLASFGGGGGAYVRLARGAQSLLASIAASSGGFVVDGTSSDVAAQLHRIVDDVASLYVIGFAASPSASIEYRRLKVEVARRDATVRHRDGYLSTPR